MIYIITVTACICALMVVYKILEAISDAHFNKVEGYTAQHILRNYHNWLIEELDKRFPAKKEKVK